jgi:transposase
MYSRERRAAIVELRVDGWSVKSIAVYLGAHGTTVYQALRRFRRKTPPVSQTNLAEGPPG